MSKFSTDPSGNASAGQKALVHLYTAMLSQPVERRRELLPQAALKLRTMAERGDIDLAKVEIMIGKLWKSCDPALPADPPPDQRHIPPPVRDQAVAKTVTWQQVVAFCLGHRDRLNPWQQSFLQGKSSLAVLSPAQLRSLREIARRCGIHDF